MVNAVISEWGVARAVPIEFKPADYREGEGKDKVGHTLAFVHTSAACIHRTFLQLFKVSQVTNFM